jgi:hypothetical protein
MESKQNQSTNIVPSDYVKKMEKISKLAGFDQQNAIVFSVLIGEIKALEKRVDDLEASKRQEVTIFSNEPFE